MLRFLVLEISISILISDKALDNSSSFRMQIFPMYFPFIEPSAFHSGYQWPECNTTPRGNHSVMEMDGKSRQDPALYPKEFQSISKSKAIWHYKAAWVKQISITS